MKTMRSAFSVILAVIARNTPASPLGFFYIVIPLLSLSFGLPTRLVMAQAPPDGPMLEQSVRSSLAQGRFADAQRGYRLAEKVYVADGKALEAARVESEMGDLYLGSGETKKALGSKMAALKRFQEMGDVDGSFHAATTIATILFGQKHLEEGARYLDEARIAARRATSMDDDDRATMASLNGFEAQLSGAKEDAIAGFRRALAIWTAAHGSEHPDVGWGHLLLGDALANAGRDQEALTELQQAVTVLGGIVSRSDTHYVTAVKAYVRLLRATGRKPEAAAVLTAAFQ